MSKTKATITEPEQVEQPADDPVITNAQFAMQIVVTGLAEARRGMRRVDGLPQMRLSELLGAIEATARRLIAERAAS